MANLTIPAETVGAMIQADAQHVRYTMDGTADPTVSKGMQLLTTQPPEFFRIEDILNIRFIRGAGSDGQLNIHYM